jgi:hypothetical protein
MVGFDVLALRGAYGYSLGALSTIIAGLVAYATFELAAKLAAVRGAARLV